MTFFNDLRDIPPVLDFEASSLSDTSYPISVGLVVKGKIHYWIIKPKPDWIDWSLASQAIHGLKHSYLIDHGMDHDEVLRELQEALQEINIIYSDNPYWERRWLRQLGELDVEVQDIKGLIPTQLHAKWKDVMQTQIKIHNFIPHRADHDALAISFTLKSLTES
ncbi:MAG TPA: hypothetical protein VLF09_07355 [Cellvibrio sp.]|nr:hypothetical protein [Cellvibrio sp.]